MRFCRYFLFIFFLVASAEAGDIGASSRASAHISLEIPEEFGAKVGSNSAAISTTARRGPLTFSNSRGESYFGRLMLESTGSAASLPVDIVLNEVTRVRLNLNSGQGLFLDELFSGSERNPLSAGYALEFPIDRQSSTQTYTLMLYAE